MKPETALILLAAGSVVFLAFTARWDNVLKSIRKYEESMKLTDEEIKYFQETENDQPLFI